MSGYKKVAVGSNKKYTKNKISQFKKESNRRKGKKKWVME